MRVSSRCFVLFAGMLVTTACRGELLATANLRGAGTAEAHFRSTGAPLVLWADTDGKWYRSNSQSRFPAHYEIDVVADGSNICHISCSTRENRGARVEACGVRSSSGGVQSGDCELKLACTLPRIPAGEVVLRVKAESGNDAIQVKRMSINVRSK